MDARLFGPLDLMAAVAREWADPHTVYQVGVSPGVGVTAAFMRHGRTVVVELKYGELAIEGLTFFNNYFCFGWSREDARSRMEIIAWIVANKMLDAGVRA